MIVGEFIADFCDKAENGIDIPTSLIYGALAKEEARLKSFMNNGALKTPMKSAPACRKS